MLAAERLGGVLEAVDIGRSPERLQPVSATFHGRDIFAPVAAALAARGAARRRGRAAGRGGAAWARASPRAHRDGALVAHVLRADHFGNLILDASHALLSSAGVRLGEAVTVQVAGQVHRGRYASTFADVAAGELLLYEDAQRMAALAVNRGSAAEQLRRRARRRDLLRAGVSALGRPRVHLRSTDSTNDRARRLAIAGAPHGTLVTASLQTAGRGRQGRRWSRPRTARC